MTQEAVVTVKGFSLGSQLEKMITNTFSSKATAVSILNIFLSIFRYFNRKGELNCRFVEVSAEMFKMFTVQTKNFSWSLL